MCLCICIYVCVLVLLQCIIIETHHSMLRYYRKYVTPPATPPIVPLYGVYRATTHDGDAALHRQLAVELGLPMGGAHVALQGLPGTNDDAILAVLAEHGYAVFGGGVGHAELRGMRAD